LKVIYFKRNGKVTGAMLPFPFDGEVMGEVAVAMAAGMPFDK